MSKRREGMSPLEVEKLRDNLTNISRKWARDNFSKKPTIKEKERAVTSMVRSESFLSYIQQLVGTNSVTTTNTTKVTNNREVPIASIDYDSYMPYKWGVDYIEIDDEARDLEMFIKEAKFPYLIESEKGMGKTLLVTDIALKYKYPLVTLSCSSGTKVNDLEGRIHVDEHGSYFQLGVIPLAIELANKYKHAIIFFDEINALDPDLQKRLNPVLDERKSILVNGKLYRLNDGCKLAIVGAMNPLSYTGVNTLNEDTKSRFIGRTWNHSVESQLDNVIDWKDISDERKEKVTTLCKSLRDLRKSGDIGYSLSTRDIKQLVSIFRMFMTHNSEEESMIKAIKTVVINHKFDNDEEREAVAKLVYDVFGYKIAV